MASNYCKVRTNVFKISLFIYWCIMMRGLYKHYNDTWKCKERSIRLALASLKGFSFLFILLMFSLLIPSVSASVLKSDIEDVYLIRPESKYLDLDYYPPEYLEVEDLVFYTCVEQDNVTLTSTVICKDDNSFDDLTLYKWEKDNCFIADYDLAVRECSDSIIRSSYDLDNEVVTIEQELKENRLTSVMDIIEEAQYSDGGWRDATDTAYGLWAMSYFPEIYKKEIDLGIEWLKNNRNNSNKCWPQDDCNNYVTSNIVGILSIAGFNNSLRVLHDGKVYLERKQNYYAPDDVWVMNITPFWEDVLCVISYNEYNESISINLSDSYVDEITDLAPENFYVLCTDPVSVDIKAYGEVDSIAYYEGDNMTFPVPGAGWDDEGRWSESELSTTLWALTTNISKLKRDAALEWVSSSQLYIEGNSGKYVGEDRNITEAALYLYAVNNTPITSETFLDIHDVTAEEYNYSEDDVLKWVRFKQNNNGSWGNGNVSDNIFPTGEVVLSLLGIGINRTNEIIEDAERWVSENELETGWNTTKANAYAFNILKNNARPFLKSVPRIIVLDSGKLTLELYNPTTYDLKDIEFEFSSDIDAVVSIEDREEILAYSYIRVDITQTKADVLDTYGFLDVKNAGTLIAHIPVMVVSFPSINISSSVESINVFGTKAVVKFNIDKTSDTFDCELMWDDSDISSRTEFNFIGQSSFNLDVKFKTAERLEKKYSGDFVCSTRDRTFLVPFDIIFDRYPSYPFTVSPTTLSINATGQEPQFTVKNLLDESIEVSIKFTKSENFFDLEKSKLTLNPGEERNITVFNLASKDFNISSINSIEVSSIGQSEKIRFDAEIIGNGGAGLSPIVLWSIIVLIVGALGVAGYLAYQNLDKVKALFHPASKIEDVKNRIRDLEKKGTRTAINNFTRMLRFQGKSDKEIRERLLSEGYSENEITDALEEK
jgi:hypothetical protein